MVEVAFFASVFSGLGLPPIAMVLLLLAKLTSGSAARRAERRFLAFLIVMTLVTAHTVMTQNAAWLIHTTTLSVMVIGSLWIPGQNSLCESEDPFFAG